MARALLLPLAAGYVTLVVGDDEVCAGGSCAASEELDAEESTLAQLRLRTRSGINKTQEVSVPCSQIDTSKPFCCWWPQSFSCSTCQQCTAGWGSCPGDNKHQCPGSGGAPTPAPTPPPTPTPGPDYNTCQSPVYYKDNGGTNMNSGVYASSANQCMDLCEQTWGCKGYTWKWDTYKCYLKSETGTPYYSSTAAMGMCQPTHPPTTPPPTPAPGPDYNSCQSPVWNQDNGGTNMNSGNDYTTSASKCMELCEQTKGCNGYTWKYDSQQCWMKSAPGRAYSSKDAAMGYCHPIDPPTPAPTPPPPAGECVGPFKGQDNDGTNMNDGSNTIVNSAQKCANKCAKKSKCKGYTFKTDSNQCWLKDQVGTLRSSYNSVSGFCNMDEPTQAPTPDPTPDRECDGPYQSLDNSGSNMNDGSQTITKSAEKCANKCIKKSKCMGYTWRSDNQQCWLKKSVEGLTYNPNAVSGYCKDVTTKTCIEPQKGWTAKGQQVGPSYTTSSPTDCMDKCSTTAECKDYTWYGWRSHTNCILFASASSYTVSPDSYVGTCRDE